MPLFRCWRPIVAVAERKPANVVGDGQSTVGDLIARKNKGRKGHLALSRIRIDSETTDLLSEQGLTPEAVPDVGQTVQLKRVSNISPGGDSVDISDLAKTI